MSHMNRKGSQSMRGKKLSSQKESLLHILQFEKKYHEIKEKFFSDKYLQDRIEKNFKSLFKEEEPQYIIFISICNGVKRAIVKKGSGLSLKEAFFNVGSIIKQYLTQNANFNPLWIKVDIVSEIEIKNYEEICNDLKYSREYFYRRGIAFDNNLKVAILESELNGRMIYDYKEKSISLNRLNKYFVSKEMPELIEIPHELLTFQCKGYIYDSQIHELYDEGYDYGRRVIKQIDKELINDILAKSSDFLIKQMEDDGKFIYGNYPIFDEEIKGYNILRHTSSLWGLVLCYKIIGNKEIKEKILLGINYLLGNITRYDENVSFVVDKPLNEIKIGGNAVAIIMLTEYMDTFQSNEFNKIISVLGNGILKLQNMSTGEFFHVLNANDFSAKAKDRTIYYDGEAVFALIRLYKYFKDDKWLKAAELSFNYFINNDYHKYADHWLSYAVNEYLKNKWDENIFMLGINNIRKNINKIYNRDTTYHTFLELLMAGFEMIQNVTKSESIAVDKIDFDSKELVKVIFHRVKHQLNGFTYPEMAMYFKSPAKVVNTFCVKHDAYRIRIDDIQHNIDGYYYFYRYFDELKKYI